MKPAKGYLDRTGYRLPTEAEWEYACRAGSATSRYYGASVRLLDRYAFYQLNSQSRAWPVASLKPNDRGLFDMPGNALEWTDSPFVTYATEMKEEPVYEGAIIDKEDRVLRVGSFIYPSQFGRSAIRFGITPSDRLNDGGLRAARDEEE